MTTSNVYGPLGESLFSGLVNYMDDTIKAMLLTSAYTPDQDAHSVVTDVSASELAGAGYTAGGLALTGKALTYDVANNLVKLDCDDLTWAGTTWTNVQYLVFYDAADPNPGNQPLLCYVNFETPQSTSGAPFTYLVPNAGFLNVTIG